MGREEIRIAVRDQVDTGLFAGLEELQALRATPFDRFAAKPARVERAPSTVAARFDVCIEIGPPPRLA
jgi:hypothetical protein